MENPKSANTATHHLLDVSNTQTETAEEISQDFLEQNLAVAREIQEYDQALPPLLRNITRLNISLLLMTATLLFLGYTILKEKNVEGFRMLSFLILECVLLIFNILEIWGFFLVCRAYFSKCCEKIEKAVSLFKLNGWVTVLLVVSNTLNYVIYKDSVAKLNCFSSLGILIATLANFLEAKEMKEVLLKRKQFSSVYSFAPN